MAYTVKEAADKLGKVKGTIEYHLKKLDPETLNRFVSVDSSGVRWINEDGFRYLETLFIPPDQREKEPEATENQSVIPLDQYRTTLKTLDILSAQIKAKDEQLKEKDAQLSRKDEQIAKKDDLLRAQSDQINDLLSQVKALNEANQNQSKANKKGWLRRLIGI